MLVDRDGRFARRYSRLCFTQEAPLALDADAGQKLVSDARSALEFNAWRDGFGDSDGEWEVLLEIKLDNV